MLDGGITVNLRPYIPLLPSNYFGDAFTISVVQIYAKNLFDVSIGNTAMINRRSINVIKAQPQKQLLEPASIKSGKSLAASTAIWLNSINLVTTDWSKCGYYSIDFGYSDLVCCRRFMYTTMRIAAILDTPVFPEIGRRGLNVCVSIDEHCINCFVIDAKLLNYAQLLD
jgi:hypothetical protein